MNREVLFLSDLKSALLIGENFQACPELNDSRGNTFHNGGLMCHNPAFHLEDKAAIIQKSTAFKIFRSLSQHSLHIRIL